VRIDGRRPAGPDADWPHLPDPISDAIKGLASRIGALERALAERGVDPATILDSDPEPDPGEAEPLRAARGPNPAGG
jgi:serine O-acetyltransferase